MENKRLESALKGVGDWKGKGQKVVEHFHPDTSSSAVCPDYSLSKCACFSCWLLSCRPVSNLRLTSQLTFHLLISVDAWCVCMFNTMSPADINVSIGHNIANPIEIAHQFFGEILFTLVFFSKNDILGAFCWTMFASFLSCTDNFSSRRSNLLIMTCWGEVAR